VKPLPTADAPFIVHPREAAKVFHGYDTDPEILLACMVVSGAHDTAEICRTEIHLANEPAPATGLEAERYETFLRVWNRPTAEENERVLEWARRIYQSADHRRKGDPHKSFAWKKGGGTGSQIRQVLRVEFRHEKQRSQSLVALKFLAAPS
jgi:hypothetical protein